MRSASRVRALLLLFTLAAPRMFAQQPLLNLVAGRSTRADVEKVFGRPASEPSRTLVEYRAPDALRSQVSTIYVQYTPGSQVADRIEGLLRRPHDRGEELAALGIRQQPALSRVNPRGTLEEYYGAPLFIVLTYWHADAESGVVRSARYSQELFAHVIRQLENR